MVGTKGLNYYPEYSIPINYFQNESSFIKTNNSNSYRLVFIEEGIGKLYINNNVIAVLPNTLLCLNEKENVSHYEVSEMKMHLLCFHPSIINGNLNYENMNSQEGLTILDTMDNLLFTTFFHRNNTFLGNLSIYKETGKRIEEILKNIMEQLIFQSNSWPCLTRSYFIELLFLTERIFRFQEAEVESAKNSPKSTVDDLLLYIHNNYRNKITIEELIKRYNTNRTTLSKKFKEATGQTIVTYILHIRVQIAAAMLRDTTLPIATIIERVGFNNITHFNKIFKEYTQYLPHEYRKSAKCC